MKFNFTTADCDSVGVAIPLFAMSEELLETALRVLSCYTALVPREPAEEDVARLRSAAEWNESGLEPDELAARIVQRTINGEESHGRDT